jgi:hypothetical protein
MIEDKDPRDPRTICGCRCSRCGHRHDDTIGVHQRSVTKKRVESLVHLRRCRVSGCACDSPPMDSVIDPACFEMAVGKHATPA